ETLTTLCPLGSLESWLASGSVTGRGLIAATVFVVSVVVFGRWFCGWICPGLLLRKKTIGGKKRIPIHAVATDKEEKSPKSEVLPMSLLAGVLGASAVFGFPVFCLICPVGLFFALVFGLWALLSGSALEWTLPAAALVLFVEFYALRRWCIVVCPLGALMRLLARLNRWFRPQATARCLKAKGVDCAVCRTVCPEGLDPSAPMSESDAAKCTKCGLCARMCPAHAVAFPVRAGAQCESIATCAVPENLKGGLLVHEAQRCVLCGKCEEACPEHKPLTQIMELLKFGKTQQAASLICAPGALPDVCGRVCPADSFCQKACPLTEGEGPVQIRQMEKLLADRGLARGPLPSLHLGKNRRVAVVGSGPSGIACAETLADKGVAVTMYEAANKVGGLLRDGIPAVKLDRGVVDGVCSRLEEAGVAMQTGCRVGEALSWKEIVGQYDAVYVAVGARRAREGVWKPTEHTEVVNVLDFLKQPETACRRHVCMIGGASAMDAALCAVLEKAASVSVVMRRSEDKVRVSLQDIAQLKEKGVKFHFAAQVTALAEDAPQAQLMTDEGRKAIEVDLLVCALGFDVQVEPQIKELGVHSGGRGEILTDGALFGQTSHPKIFAGGDAVRGPSYVSSAARDGRQAAHSILKYLGG
ncbi:MAG: FAD-dependent oxidoreductase, partial [Duodenibacillus sp.]